MLSIRGELQAANQGRGEAPGAFARPYLHTIYFPLEGVSEAEIGLDKVVAATPAMIDEVITRLAEQPNVGRKAVFEAAADVADWAALGARTDVVEPVIELRKAGVDRLPIPAREN